MYTQYLGRSQSFNPRKVKAYWREAYPDLAPSSSVRKHRSAEYREGKKLAVRRNCCPCKQVSSCFGMHAALMRLPEHWREFFSRDDKRDDLADSLLQAIYVARMLRGELYCIVPFDYSSLPLSRKGLTRINISFSAGGVVRLSQCSFVVVAAFVMLPWLILALSVTACAEKKERSHINYKVFDG
jgi:hypothetical protein